MAEKKARANSPLGTGAVLIALILGFALGLAVQGASALIAIANVIGGIWLDLLRMTIVPLVFALVTTGIADLRARGAEAGRLGRRLAIAMAALLALAGALAAGLVPPLLGLSQIDTAAIAKLSHAIGGGAPPTTPNAVDTLRAFIPTNVFAAAASGAIVPLVVFAAAFGAVLGGMEAKQADALLLPLRTLAAAMLAIVGAVLRLAPVGVFMLGLNLGATAGLDALAALGYFLGISILLSLVLIVICTAIAVVLGGVGLPQFVRAAAGPLLIAAGTQSSLATLPASLGAARQLGVPERDAAVSLPLSVAVFKITGPSNGIATGIALAWMAGIHIDPVQLAVAVPLSMLTSLAILGLPGQVSYYASAAPLAVALGAPIGMLPVLLAVDPLSDMVRTSANVAAQLAATLVAARGAEADQSENEVASRAAEMPAEA